MGKEVMTMILAVVAFIVLFLLVYFVTRRKNESSFDERQQIIRMRGYMYGFAGTMIAGAVIACCALVTDDYIFNLFESPVLVLVFVLFVGIIIWAVYSVMHDSYFGIGENKRKFIIIDIVIAALNIVSVVARFCDGSMIKDGKITVGVFNLYCAIMLVSLLIAVLIRGKQVKDEESEA